MSGVLFRYVARIYCQYVGATFLVILAVFLIADFGDRMKMIADHTVGDVAGLYANKALVYAQQLGPAAMLLAGGAGVSTLRKRGELTALKALSFTPASLYLPIGLCALAVAGLLIAFDELVVTSASARVDEISAGRFNSWRDWDLFHRPQRWFRLGERVFHLRQGDVERGFEDVTVLTLGPEFKIASRIDARRMSYASPNAWLLEDAVERSFIPEPLKATSWDHRFLELGLAKEVFQVKAGRPEQLRASELAQELSKRGKVGLPAQRVRLALHNRFAYPLTGVVAALLAVGLALRPGRRGHLTVALLEGLGIAAMLWGTMVIAKALAISDRLSAPWAAWLPGLSLLLGAALLWLRHEGKLGRGGA